MQSCFTKLYAFARGHGACKKALGAIARASNWDELCAHPKAGEWSVWVAIKLGGPLLADHEATLAPLWADYEAKRALLWADYEAKRAPLQAD